MATHTNEVILPFDFTEALSLTPEQRMQQCVERIRERLLDEDEWDFFDLPPVPERGASESELKKLEAKLGAPLPAEYRAFLRNWRYLILHDGLNVWGFDDDGLSIGKPRVSDKLRKGVRYLVFGDYWEHADGDQFMFDLSQPEAPVIAYLHEHGPLYEHFAPSFSLALWRMVEEW